MTREASEELQRCEEMEDTVDSHKLGKREQQRNLSHIKFSSKAKNQLMTVAVCKNLPIKVSPLPVELLYNPVIDKIKETEVFIKTNPCAL